MDPNMILTLNIDNENKESFSKIMFNLNYNRSAFIKSSLSVILRD